VSCKASPFSTRCGADRTERSRHILESGEKNQHNAGLGMVVLGEMRGNLCEEEYARRFRVGMGLFSCGDSVKQNGRKSSKFTSLFDPWRIEDFEHPNLGIVSLRGSLVPRGLDFWIVGSAKFPVGDNPVSQDLEFVISCVMLFLSDVRSQQNAIRTSFSGRNLSLSSMCTRRVQGKQGQATHTGQRFAKTSWGPWHGKLFPDTSLSIVR
jgi:hypothetical protein